MLTRSFNKKTIDDLPDEILITILEFIDTFEWNKCKRISKKWKDICDIKLVKKKYLERRLLENLSIKIFKINKGWKNEFSFDTESNDFIQYNSPKKLLKIYRDYPYKKTIKYFYITDRVYNVIIKNKKVYIIHNEKVIIWDYYNSSFEKIDINSYHYSYNDISVTNNGKLFYVDFYKKKEVSYLLDSNFSKRKLKFDFDISSFCLGKEDTIFASDESGCIGKLTGNRVNKIRVFHKNYSCYVISANKNNYFCVSNFEDVKLYNNNNVLINTFSYFTDEMAQIVLNDKINIFDYSNDVILTYNMKGKLLNEYERDDIRRIKKGPYNSLIFETGYYYGNKNEFYIL